MNKEFGKSYGYKTKKSQGNHSDMFHRQRAYYGIYLPNKEKYEYPFSYYEVHHKDGDKTNNEISNLKVLTPKEHDLEHKFYETYGVWEYEFNRMTFPYLKKYDISIEKIKKIWKKISAEIRNYFVKEEFESLMKNNEIDELELNLRIRERNKEISLVTWKRVQKQLKENGFLKEKKAINLEQFKKMSPFKEDKNKFELYEKLRKKRMQIAKKRKIMAYMVFHNKTLELMVNLKPKNKEEMLKIEGVSENNFAKYGKDFLECINGN